MIVSIPYTPYIVAVSSDIYLFMCGLTDSISDQKQSLMQVILFLLFDQVLC